MNNRGIPDEYPITLTVNGFEIAIFQLTNLDLEDWACGYLYSEGYIQSIDDIISIMIHEEIGRIDAVLKNEIDADQWFGKKKHYTAGCGRGVPFFSMTDVKNFTPVSSNAVYSLSYLLKKQSEFAQNSPLYLENFLQYMKWVHELVKILYPNRQSYPDNAQIVNSIMNVETAQSWIEATMLDLTTLHLDFIAQENGYLAAVERKDLNIN